MQCDTDYSTREEKNFCCNGCEVVFSFLQHNGLGNYYNIDDLQGVSFKNKSTKKYSFLDDPKIIDRLVSSNIGGKCRIKLNLPSIHCSSCIWLLEHLHKLDEGIQNVRVNFIKKEAIINYDNKVTSLRTIAELLSKIGYDPELNMQRLENADGIQVDKSLIYKIGVAGFCFGNIMLLSFPDYLGDVESGFHNVVAFLILGLSLPVLFYSGRDYLSSAWKSLNVGQLSIDVPVAIGMLTLFGRSAYEIVTQSGIGYLDSFAGFVFFLLIGKWFQGITHNAISFDRNYKSYFPLSVQVKENNNWKVKAIDQVEVSDTIMVRNKEIIPCDGIMKEGKARIDYSFVTGESELVKVELDDKIFAGGKQVGSAIIIDVTKRVEKSYLTDLWNNESFTERKDNFTSLLLNGISKYFTLTILAIAGLTFAAWAQIDISKSFNAVTAVLIIACPCVLALSIPFIYGNAIRILGHFGFFLKSTKTLEDLQEVDTVVFDKTGTITNNMDRKTWWKGEPVSASQITDIKSLCQHSSHPLCKAIVSHLDGPIVDIDSFEEITGLGVKGVVGNNEIKLGSSKFIFNTIKSQNSQEVIIEYNHKILGYFEFKNELRKGVKDLMENLTKEKLNLHLISGDNAHDRDRMASLFENTKHLHFNQDPQEKLEYIKRLQKQGHKVMMIGDGLNDAGALMQADVGVVLSDSANNFTPASDIIINENSFSRLFSLFRFSHFIKFAFYGGLLLALLYNTIGLYFATTAQLSPIVAAILMPASSITIILYGIVSGYFISYKLLKGKWIFSLENKDGSNR